MTMSGLILVAACIVIAIWDLIAVTRYGLKNTVSAWVHNQAILHPTLIFATGVLVGHFFASLNAVVK